MSPCKFSQSSFGIHVDFLSVVKGGFFLMKKPLECVLSVYTNSETAIAALTLAYVDDVSMILPLPVPHGLILKSNCS